MICLFTCRECKGDPVERRIHPTQRDSQFCRECGEQLDNVSLGGDLTKGVRSTGIF